MFAGVLCARMRQLYLGIVLTLLCNGLLRRRLLSFVRFEGKKQRNCTRYLFITMLIDPPGAGISKSTQSFEHVKCPPNCKLTE